VHQDQSEEVTQPPGAPEKTKLAGFRGYLAESQYQYRSSPINLIAGGGYYTADNYDSFLTDTYGTTHGNAYSYGYLHVPYDITLTLGLSFDEFEDESLGRHSQINPKLGVLWQATKDTTVRLAGFRTMKRPLANDQTIEPTQVAGFNQLRDDVNGTDSTRYGVGVDHKFSPAWLTGFELSRRDLKSTFFGHDRQEDQVRGYLYWTPTDELALSVGYQLERFRHGDFIKDSIPETTTHLLPASVAYFHGSGLFSRLGFTYVDQETYRGPTFPGADDAQANERFTLVDYALGYRLPKRYGIIQFQVKNLFDTQFEYQGNHFRSVYQDEVSSFVPGRAFFGQVSLAF
ncbi:MAG: tetratricopeptide repeat domain protein, partial [Proteobacteria bacterium]|nr:tetratricopeptide repeat domain protein [Pseudomonadota bacterium]